MFQNYESMCRIAQNLGFSKFTPLQELAFQNPKCYEPASRIFVIGNTSSGKTLIPLLLYFSRVLAGESPKMLFAVPYRSLAAQKCIEIREIAARLNLELKIEQCTGEFRSADTAVRLGEVDIAVIIYEKVFMFSSMDSAFLEHYDDLVMDEIGLTQDIDRGIKADFVLARANSLHSLRIIALGTPFYNWNSYLDHYGFVKISYEKRPVDLKILPVYCTREGINHVEPDCQAIGCRPARPYHNEESDANQIQWLDQIVEDICRYHLRLNHKILIFENNREEVRKRAQRLCRVLAPEGLLPGRMTIEESKARICAEMDISEEDAPSILYHIMEQEDYEAFSCGVSYHNASLPNPLRTLVEREVLNADGCLQIVCSTETLAYGINSNVDVVIIPDMTKQRAEEDNVTTFLRANEYMNYAGRAGRLQKGVQQDVQQPGYVYPLIRAVYSDTGISAPPKGLDQQKEWETMLRASQTPELIHSLYFSPNEKRRPMYLLSMFPHKHGIAYPYIRVSELEDSIRHLPHCADLKFDRQAFLLEPLAYLLDKQIIRTREEWDDWDDLMDEDPDPGDTEYCLTDIGAALTGYIIQTNDLNDMMQTACACIGQNHMYIVDLVYAILGGEEIRKLVSSAAGSLKKTSLEDKKSMLRSVCRMLQKNKHLISPQLQQTVQKNTGIVWLEDDLDDRKIRASALNNRLRVTAAMLMWTDPNFTPRQLYKAFRITEQQMQKVAEKVSYHLDILRLAFPAFASQAGIQLDGDRILQIYEQLDDLSKAYSFRVSPKICRLYEIEATNPENVKLIKKLTVLHSYLNRIDRTIVAGGTVPKKVLHNLRRRRAAIDRLPDEPRQKIHQLFERVLTYGN